MRLATQSFAPRASLLGEITSSVVKMVLSFSDRAQRIADAHDARQRFAHLPNRHLNDIGLTDADRDYRLNH